MFSCRVLPSVNHLIRFEAERLRVIYFWLEVHPWTGTQHRRDGNLYAMGDGAMCQVL